MDAWGNDRLECLFLFGELKGQDSTIWYGKYLITCKSSLGIQTYTVNIDNRNKHSSLSLPHASICHFHILI
jgi:hypothetical protein